MFRACALARPHCPAPTPAGAHCPRPQQGCSRRIDGGWRPAGRGPRGTAGCGTGARPRRPLTRPAVTVRARPGCIPCRICSAPPAQMGFVSPGLLGEFCLQLRASARPPDKSTGREAAASPLGPPRCCVVLFLFCSFIFIFSASLARTVHSSPRGWPASSQLAAHKGVRNLPMEEHGRCTCTAAPWAVQDLCTTFVAFCHQHGAWTHPLCSAG